MNSSRARVLLEDGAIAAALAATALTEFAMSFGDDSRAWRAALLLTLENLALVVRRTHPLVAWAAAGVATAAYGLGSYDDPYVHYGALVALYSVAVHSPRARSRIVGAATLAFIVVVLLVDGGNADAVDWTAALVTAAVAWLLGENVRITRAYAAEMQRRAEDAERHRDEDAQRAVAEERLRMARELHDVTAHHLSVVAVQAEAGQALLPTDPAGADAALGRIASSARDALTDLRRSVAALRKSDESRHPQPGLDRLPALAEEVRAAGTPVELRVERDGAISDALEVSAYRIVQEALTNVLRHAPGTAADVAVRCRADAVVIEVSNPCDGGVAARTSGGGHGLVGLHERAAMLGGTLEAGRRDGRFVVRATLPR